MMAKKVDGRPPSMWEFLKEFRAIELFNKRPRIPEESVFEDMPGYKSAEDLLKRGSGNKDDQEA